MEGDSKAQLKMLLGVSLGHVGVGGAATVVTNTPAGVI